MSPRLSSPSSSWSPPVPLRRSRPAAPRRATWSSPGRPTSPRRRPPWTWSTGRPMAMPPGGGRGPGRGQGGRGASPAPLPALRPLRPRSPGLAGRDARRSPLRPAPGRGRRPRVPEHPRAPGAPPALAGLRAALLPPAGAGARLQQGVRRRASTWATCSRSTRWPVVRPGRRRRAPSSSTSIRSSWWAPGGTSGTPRGAASPRPRSGGTTPTSPSPSPSTPP